MHFHQTEPSRTHRWIRMCTAVLFAAVIILCTGMHRALIHSAMHELMWLNFCLSTEPLFSFVRLFVRFNPKRVCMSGRRCCVTYRRCIVCQICSVRMVECLLCKQQYQPQKKNRSKSINLGVSNPFSTKPAKRQRHRRRRAYGMTNETTIG